MTIFQGRAQLYTSGQNHKDKTHWRKTTRDHFEINVDKTHAQKTQEKANLELVKMSTKAAEMNKVLPKKRREFSDATKSCKVDRTLISFVFPSEICLHCVGSWIASTRDSLNSFRVDHNRFPE